MKHVILVHGFFYNNYGINIFIKYFKYVILPKITLRPFFLLENIIFTSKEAK